MRRAKANLNYSPTYRPLHKLNDKQKRKLLERSGVSRERAESFLEELEATFGIYCRNIEAPAKPSDKEVLAVIASIRKSTHQLLELLDTPQLGGAKRHIQRAGNTCLGGTHGQYLIGETLEQLEVFATVLRAAESLPATDLDPKQDNTARATLIHGVITAFDNAGVEQISAYLNLHTDSKTKEVKIVEASDFCRTVIELLSFCSGRTPALGTIRKDIKRVWKTRKSDYANRA